MFHVKHLLPEGQSVGLLTAHLSGFVGRLVSLPEEVEHAVDENAVEFLLERDAKREGILPYPVDADENVARDEVGGDIVEGDDVGVGVVVKELTVDLKDVVIVAEEVGDVADLLATPTDYLGDPLTHLLGHRELEIYILTGKADRHDD